MGAKITLRRRSVLAPAGSVTRALGAGALVLMLAPMLPQGAVLAQDAAADPAASQPQTATMPNIADLRADLDAVAADLQTLRAALRVSGTAGYAQAGGPDAISRMDRMEAALRQLTGMTEQARNRIEFLTRDSAGRLADFEFRLCQIEPDCDLAALADGGSADHGSDIALGGTSGQGVVRVAAPTAPAASSLPASTGERADLDAATALADAGDTAGAAQAFATVARNHAGGPLFTEARFGEGQALLALGDMQAAARALTEVFSADPMGPHAPAALVGVAQIMAGDGQTQPACLLVGEVIMRHADSPQAATATALYDQLDCGVTFDPDLPDAADLAGAHEGADDAAPAAGQ